jgi:hypothetical protein
MASHLSSIGLPVDSEDDFFDLAQRASESSEVLEVHAGRYLRWSSPSGAELWLQVDEEDSLIGMNPHFAGASRLRVGLTGRLTRAGATALDGAFHGWASPPGDEPEQGAYPFVFDAPDFLLHSDVEIPSVVEVQVAAFAHEVQAHLTEEEHGKSQEAEMRFAAQSFIPSGLFSPEGEAPGEPESLAIFSGLVLRAEVRTNELSGKPFYWALVDSYGGAYDVVIDPELLPEPPVVGGVLNGSFWLSGRLLR